MYLSSSSFLACTTKSAYRHSQPASSRVGDSEPHWPLQSTWDCGTRGHLGLSSSMWSEGVRAVSSNLMMQSGSVLSIFKFIRSHLVNVTVVITFVSLQYQMGSQRLQRTLSWRVQNAVWQRHRYYWHSYLQQQTLSWQSASQLSVGLLFFVQCCLH